MQRIPNVSVVIPSFNMGDLISDAIESVLHQTYDHFEIIVIDDGSDDNTREVVKRYSGIGVRYFYQANSGPASARNTGIRLSRGEFVAFLDADDLWLPDKLECQMKAFRKLNIGMIACGYKLVDYSSGRTWSEIVRHNFPSKEDLMKSLYISQIIPACSSGVVINMDCFREVGYFNETLKIAEDWELWLRIARSYEIKFVEQPLVLIRVNLEKPSVRVTANEELFVSKVIEDQVPKKYRAKAYAALYARLASNCLSRLDKRKAVNYLLRSIFLNPYRIYPRDKKNKYMFPHIWRYYLLIKSFVPEGILRTIKFEHLLSHKAAHEARE